MTIDLLIASIQRARREGDRAAEARLLRQWRAR
jgi:hypothetical protein